MFNWTLFLLLFISSPHSLFLSFSLSLSSYLFFSFFSIYLGVSLATSYWRIEFQKSVMKSTRCKTCQKIKISKISKKWNCSENSFVSFFDTSADRFGSHFPIQSCQTDLTFTDRPYLYKLRFRPFCWLWCSERLVCTKGARSKLSLNLPDLVDPNAGIRQSAWDIKNVKWKWLLR